MFDETKDQEATETPSWGSQLLDALVPSLKTRTTTYEPARGWLRRGLDTLTNGAKFCFKPLSASEIIAHVDTAMTWLWEQYIAVGDFVLFTAYMKVGKSTLIYPLVLAVARGVAFLNRATLKGAVLVLALEESVRDVKLRLAKLGMIDTDPIYVHPGLFPCTPEALEQLEKFIVANQIVLVVLDSLSAYWDVTDENSNAEVIRKAKPLLDLARRTKAAIVLVHHERKGSKDQRHEGNDGKAIRGASALFGLVDQALSLAKATGNVAA